MTTILKFVISCGLEEAFQGICFGHAMSKAYQYGMVNEKVSFGLHEILIKFAQTKIKKCIT
jgi:hypothetical protein